MANVNSTLASACLHLCKSQATLSVPVDEEAILTLARRILKKRFKRYSRSFEDMALVEAYLTQKLGGREQEVFSVLFLDQKHRLIRYQELFFGSIDQAEVYPREMIKQALKFNAAVLIAVHNHPSGSTTPSEADIVITQELKTALALLDIRLLDHFIVAGAEMVSLNRLGKC